MLTIGTEEYRIHILAGHSLWLTEHRVGDVVVGYCRLVTRHVT